MINTEPEATLEVSYFLDPAAVDVLKRAGVPEETLNRLAPLRDRAGRGWVLGTQGRAEMLMAAHCMKKIETVYGSVFEGILGQKVSPKPVEIVNPFPWHGRGKGEKN